MRCYCDFVLRLLYFCSIIIFIPADALARGYRGRGGGTIVGILALGAILYFIGLLFKQLFGLRRVEDGLKMFGNLIVSVCLIGIVIIYIVKFAKKIL
jgi:hypothetical protein